MNLFARKVHMFCVSNIMLSFVCTGFLGVRTTTGIINGSTTDEAHEISLTASDTEPVSHNGEGENSIAFITQSLEAVIIGQEETVFPEFEGEENEFAFITQSVKAVIDQQENALADQKVETKKATKTTAKSSSKSKTTSKKTTTSSSKKKTTTKTVSYTKPSYSSVTGDAIVSFAKKFMGLRYVRAGRSLKTGTDCSGFTMLIYREFGVSLPPTVSGQIGKGKYVAKKDLQKGDLVFYKAKGSRGGASHVGIYIGGGSVIHESKPGVGVKISTVNMMQYVTARRVINSKATQIAKAKSEAQNNVVTDKTSSTPNSNTGTTNNIESNSNNTVSATVAPSATPSSTPVATVAPATPTPTPETPKVTVTPTPKVEVTENTSIEGSN